jgi:hypothetical protein
MEGFGKAKLDFFKTFLELPNGIPDETDRLSGGLIRGHWPIENRRDVLLGKVK